MTMKIAFVLFAIGLAVPALGYSAGAPKEACDDMVPQHGTDAKTTSAPYYLQLSRTTQRSGDQIQLTVTGKDKDDKIRGFMIQARSGNKRIGNFIVDPNDTFVQTVDCSGEKATAVTHKKHDEKDDKRSITVTWAAPKGFKGEINFRATIVLNGGVFWVGVESDKVKVV